MNRKRQNNPEEETGVADVRRAREAIARQHAGNLQEHIEETNRMAEPIRKKLGIKLVMPPTPPARRSGTGG
jgi:hypothetical protein